jgi:hypothetical protein
MTTVAPAQAAPTPGIDNPLRITPIAADLLPAEVAQSRHTKRVRRLVVFALVVFVALLGAWYGGEYLRTEVQRADLSAAQDTVTDLKVRQKKYNGLVRIQAQTAAIDAQLATLMANDVQWATLIASVRQAVPAGVELTGVNATVNLAGGAVGDRSSSGGQQAAIGTLTVNGYGPSKPAIAQYVDALGKLTGYANPFLTSAAAETGQIAFSVRVEVSRVALDSRFVPKKAGK